MPHSLHDQIRLQHLVILLALTVLLAACSRSTQLLGDTPTPTSQQATVPAPIGLPDLRILSVQLVVEDDQPCFETNTQLEVSLLLENSGESDSGVFALKLNGFELVLEHGLGAGESQALTLRVNEPDVIAQIDTRSQVAESNETNNQLSQRLEVPTASPACFPTPIKEIPVIEVQSQLEGHRGRVLSLDFSPDGRLLVSAGVDNTMRLWRISELSLLRTMQGHPFPITRVVFSPDGQQIATGSVDSVARVWQVDNASLRYTLAEHADWITSLAYSPDGRILATGSHDFTVRLWRIPGGARRALIDEGMTGIRSLAFSPNNNDLAWAEAGGAVRIWQTQESRWLHTWKTSDTAACCVAFSPSGESLAAGFEDGAIRIWAVSRGDLLVELRAEGGSIRDVAFFPDGRYLAAAGAGEVYLWLWQEGASEISQSAAPDAILGGGQVEIHDIAVSPDSSLLAAAGENGSILVWTLPEP